MAVFICLVFGLILPWIFGRTPSKMVWITASLFMAGALLLPNALAIIYKPWIWLSHILGMVNTRILLTLIFYLIFTPTALVLKLTGKDPMERQFKDESTPSYWKESIGQPKTHMETIY